MSGAWEVELTGLSSLRMDSAEIRRAAAIAVNRIARDGRALAAREIRDQVNLPAKYLTPAGGRLTVIQRATAANPTSVIRGRGRPTSLAQYVQGNPKPSVPGVYLEVAPGRVRFMSRAFLIRLRSGGELTDTKFNMGLAIRLRKGERLSNKTNFTKTKDGLYLMYGPSVDQVFLSNDGKGVAAEIAPDLVGRLQREFERTLRL